MEANVSIFRSFRFSDLVFTRTQDGNAEVVFVVAYSKEPWFTMKERMRKRRDYKKESWRVLKDVL